jgi:hypothetical protein
MLRFSVLILFINSCSTITANTTAFEVTSPDLALLL